MQVEQPKKNRSTNWTEQERNLLKMLIFERADVIENKEGSTNANVAKRIAWEEVLSRFNTINTIQRDIAQLHNQWRNMKNKSKKSSGDSIPLSPPAEDRETMEVVPQLDSNCFDSDCNDTNEEVVTTWVHDPLAPVFEGIAASSVKLEKSATAHVVEGVPTTAVEQEKMMLTGPSSKEIPGEMSLAPGSFKRKWKRHGPLNLNIINNASPKSEQARNKQYKQKNKSKTYNFKCCTHDHEHEIFIIQTKHREEIMRQEKEAHECKMMYEQEAHAKRMTIMSLEEQYWRKKIKQLDT